jgi:5'(3')-deoxyribonucleotidase
MYSNKEVPPGFESDLNNIAIDFDGVIHTFDKGFHDGTCYGDPIEGSLEAIKKLSEKYNIIIFTAKAKPDTIRWIGERL